MRCWAKLGGMRLGPEEYFAQGGRVLARLEYDIGDEFLPLGGRGISRYAMHICNAGSAAPEPGGTPLVEAGGMLFKLEYLNPSGSFKDRGAFTGLPPTPSDVVVDSSGNAGISFTLYGRAAGHGVTVYTPRGVSEGKRRLLELLGAEVVFARDREEAHRMALSARGVYVGHWLNPFFLVGVRTIAYEVYEEGVVPGSVIVPVGSGSLLLGLYMGFRDLMEWGLVDDLPRLIAVRAAGHDELFGIGGHCTLAEGLMIPSPPRGPELRRAVRESGGWAEGVEDEDILEALKWSLKRGFIIEPTSASAVAVALRLRDKVEEPVLVPLTGSGLKRSETFLNK
ncbi:MAG: pyridoxal-phosphate dependent enzyme [Thermoplasmata archaeon]|nr:pyridoxal-phosphate dependent enzyme [Thermoplasmata archaeon]